MSIKRKFDEIKNNNASNKQKKIKISELVTFKKNITLKYTTKQSKLIIPENITLSRTYLPKGQEVSEGFPFTSPESLNKTDNIYLKLKDFTIDLISSVKQRRKLLSEEKKKREVKKADLPSYFDKDTLLSKAIELYDKRFKIS
jgi:hypothetical protein